MESDRERERARAIQTQEKLLTIHLRATIRLRRFFVLFGWIDEDCISLSAITYHFTQFNFQVAWPIQYSFDQSVSLWAVGSIEFEWKCEGIFTFLHNKMNYIDEAKRQLFALYACTYTYEYFHVHINSHRSLTFNQSCLRLWGNLKKKDLTFLKCKPHCAKLYLISCCSVDRRKSEFRRVAERNGERKKLMHKWEATVNKLWSTIIRCNMSYLCSYVYVDAYYLFLSGSFVSFPFHWVWYVLDRSPLHTSNIWYMYTLLSYRFVEFNFTQFTTYVFSTRITSIKNYQHNQMCCKTFIIIV